MPRFIKPVENLRHSMLRPSTLDIIRQLAALVEMPRDNLNIVYAGDGVQVPQPRSTIDASTDVNLTEGRSRIKVTVEDTYDPASLLTMAASRANAPFVFEDRALGIYIRPAFSTTRVDVSFELRAANRNDAKAWRDQMKAKIDLLRELYLFNTSYHYVLPKEQVYLLYHLWVRRENVEGYGQSFEEYFREHATPQLSWIVNQSGTEGVWAISDTQTRIQGYFDFEGIPEKGERPGEQETWAISFTFTYQIDVPTNCEIIYPVMVHNQPLSVDLLPANGTATAMNVAQRRSLTLRDFRHFESENFNEITQVFPGLSIPQWDEFVPTFVLTPTLRMYSALCTLLPREPNYLMDLDQFSSQYTMDSDVLQFLKDEWQWVTKPLQSIFGVSVYRNRELLDYEKINVDENLKVTSLIDLSLRDVHHVRLALSRRLRTLSARAITAMRVHGKATVKILKALDGSDGARLYIPQLLDGWFITPQEMTKVIDSFALDSPAPTEATTRNLKTVQILFVRVGAPQGTPAPAQL